MSIEQLIVEQALSQNLVELEVITEIEATFTGNADSMQMRYQYLLENIIQRGFITIEWLEKTQLSLLKGNQRDTLPVSGTNVVMIDDLQTRHQDPSSPKVFSVVSTHEKPGFEIGPYVIEKLLGSGGMGHVYLAYSKQLERYVALKILKKDDPEIVQRFLQEAKLQAQVEHENVCRVYGINAGDERPYIAMQYIDGVTLKEAAETMTLEQKLTIIRSVALALHAAHRQGLIHRDIKPENIMIERDESGIAKPYILDFGLARQQAAPNVTKTGMVLGTPHYMSPEQLTGGQRTIDRRTDIYSLGATLYEIIVGQPLFDNSDSFGVMLKILNNDPVPLHKIDPSVPRDVETIVLKCIEKTAQRRYASARLLANDIENYLNGDPIMARRANIFYTLSLKAKKHRIIVTISAIALFSVLFMVVLSVRTALQARERIEFTRKQAELQQQLNVQIKEIESIMRFTRMMPVHDTTPVRSIIQGKMEIISAQKEKLGAFATGPILYALGRGYLILNDYESAFQNLDIAWHSGFQGPEVATALGKTYAQLYQKELRTLDRLDSEEIRHVRQKKIEIDLRDRALKLLQQGKQVELDSPLYITALIAFYENRLEDALLAVNTALANKPWLYEALALKGEIFSKWASKNYADGEREKFHYYREQAFTCFDSARAIGRSDRAVYHGFAQFCLSMLQIEHLQGNEGKLWFNKGLNNCELMLSIQPRLPETLNMAAHLHLEEAEFEFQSGLAPFENIQWAMNILDESLEIDENFSETTLNYGIARRMMGEYNAERGADPSEFYLQAIRDFKSVSTSDDSNLLAIINLCRTHLSRAAYLIQQNKNAWPDLNEAEKLVRKSSQKIENPGAFRLNIARTEYLKGLIALKDDSDPSPFIAKGIETLSENSGNLDGYDDRTIQLARLHVLKGRYLTKRGQNPEVPFNTSEKLLKKQLQNQRFQSQTPLELAELSRWQAAWNLLNNKELTDIVQRGMSYINQSLEMHRTAARAYLIRGHLHLLQALQEEEREAKKVLLLQAEKDLKQAVALNKNVTFETTDALIQIKHLLQ